MLTAPAPYLSQHRCPVTYNIPLYYSSAGAWQRQYGKTSQERRPPRASPAQVFPRMFWLQPGTILVTAPLSRRIYRQELILYENIRRFDRLQCMEKKKEDSLAPALGQHNIGKTSPKRRIPGLRPLKFSVYCRGLNAGTIPVTTPLSCGIYRHGNHTMWAQETLGSAAMYEKNKKIHKHRRWAKSILRKTRG